MFLSSWRKLKHLVRGNNKGLQGQPRRSDSKRKSRWLGVEVLEERVVRSTFQWTLASDGSWSNASNWTKLVNTNASTYPQAPGDIAQFNASGSYSTAAKTVTVNAADATAGEIDFGATGNFTINS